MNTNAEQKKNEECKPKKNNLTYHKESWKDFAIDTIEILAIYTIIYFFLSIMQHNFEVYRTDTFLRNITGLFLIKLTVDLVFEDKKNVYLKNIITILILAVLFDIFKHH